MATTCVFCGARGTMTNEHVLPDWLERCGLASQPAAASSGWLTSSGWLNRSLAPGLGSCPSPPSCDPGELLGGQG